MAQAVFRIEVGGFFNTFATLSEVAAWVAELKRDFPDIVGKTATVWQGEGTVECYMLAPGCPRRELTVSPT